MVPLEGHLKCAALVDVNLIEFTVIHGVDLST